MKEIKNKEELEKMGLRPIHTLLVNSGIPFFHLAKSNEFIFKHYANETIQEICESPLWQSTIAIKMANIEKKIENFHFTGDYFGLHYCFFHIRQKNISILMGGNRSEQGKKKEGRLSSECSALVRLLPMEDSKNIMDFLIGLKNSSLRISSDLDKELFQEICAYLQQDLTIHHTLASLAHTFYCHEKKIERLFYRQVSKSFSKFYVEMRMEQAKKWLETGQFNVGEVSKKLGYHQKQSFSRAFRDYFGFSPHELRRDSNESSKIQE